MFLFLSQTLEDKALFVKDLYARLYRQEACCDALLLQKVALQMHLFGDFPCMLYCVQIMLLLILPEMSAVSQQDPWEYPTW